MQMLTLMALYWHCDANANMVVPPTVRTPPGNIVSKNQIILTDGSRDILIFVFPPCVSDLESHKHLQQCLFPLHQHQCLLHLLLSCVKPLSMCHLPHMTGMQLTRCMSLDCSSASLILGPGFTGIKAEECLDYLLCILGKEDYAAYGLLGSY